MRMIRATTTVATTSATIRIGTGAIGAGGDGRDGRGGHGRRSACQPVLLVWSVRLDLLR